MRKRPGNAHPHDGTFLRSCDAWLRREERGAEDIARRVAALDFIPATIEILRSIHPNALTIGVARKLTALAHIHIGTTPKKSAAIALLACRVSEAASVPSKFVVVLDTARGEAWMRYAAAMFELGRFPDAWAAADRAEAYFQLASPFPPAFRSETTLGLIQGKILYFMGETDRGLLLIEQSANLLLNVFEQRDKYVEALTIYNALLMRAGQYAEAARRWAEMEAMTRESGEDVMLAHIVNNVGRCYLQMGRNSEAEECFQTAAELFEQLGMRTDRVEARLNFAYVLRSSGRHCEAIAALDGCRVEFARLGMAVSAAEVCIRLIETRLLADSDEGIYEVCEQAITYFQEAGLPERAAMLTEHLLCAAQAGTLDLETVRKVCIFLPRLPEVNFEAGN